MNLSNVRAVTKHLPHGFGMRWLAVLLLLLAVAVQAQTPAFRWAARSGGTEDDFGNAIAVDAQGNCYVTGSFSGVAHFGMANYGAINWSGNAGQVLTTRGFSDIFIAKYDKNGGIVWIKQAGGEGEDYARGIALDSEGNCYVTGYFYSSTATFGGVTLARTGTCDLFTAKYDASGNCLWAKQAGGGGGAFGYAIAVDTAGNAYVTGSYFNNLTFEGNTLTNAGFADAVVAKYDRDGYFMWARQAGSVSDDSGNGIAVDGAGNVYVTGNFSRTLRFGYSSISSGERPTIFNAKFDTNGKFLWGSQISASRACYGRAIGVDALGNCYITGSISGDVSIGDRAGDKNFFPRLPSSGSMRSEKECPDSVSAPRPDVKKARETVNTPVNRHGDMDHTDILIVKLDTNGRQQWVRTAGGSKPTAESGFAIAVDPVGNSYVAGNFSGRARFGGTAIISSAVEDIFISQYDRHGNLIWLRQAGGPSGEPHGAYGIAIDPAGNSYITGYVRREPSFGNIDLRSNFNVRNTGDADIFIARLGLTFFPPR